MFRQWFDQRRIIRQDSILEVAAVLALRAHARTSQVRTAEIGLFSIRDDAFEMDTRTQHPFDPGPQSGKSVEVLSKSRAGLANPLSLVLSGEMLLRHAGFAEAADMVLHSVEKSISGGQVTKDFATLMVKEGRDATCVGTKEFGKILISNL